MVFLRYLSDMAAEVCRWLKGRPMMGDWYTRGAMEADLATQAKRIEELEGKLGAVRKHRCSGCDLCWDGIPWEELPGAELCGDCWRKAQPLIHGCAAATTRGVDLLGRVDAAHPNEPVCEIVASAVLRDGQFLDLARFVDGVYYRVIVCAPDLLDEARRLWPAAVHEPTVGIGLKSEKEGQ